MEVVSLPLQGFSAKPIFDQWVIEDYAHVLSWACQLPYEQPYYPGKGMMTFLHDDKGRPTRTQFDGSALAVHDQARPVVTE